jgi:hypothetical protein
MLAANLRNESHLVGDGAFGDTNKLASFLKELGKRHARAKSMLAREKRYNSTCRKFELKGLAIPRPHLPDALLRYSTSRTLAAKIVERLLGKAARWAFDNGTMTPEDAFARLVPAWASSRLTPKDRLSRGTGVFATFDHAAGAPRGDARAMSEALALPVAAAGLRRDEILYEFAYATDSVDNHRFPTVADAGRSHLFEPAPEVEPEPANAATWWGWTRPLGARPPQPEIVHANESLRILKSPPRFVGRIR